MAKKSRGNGTNEKPSRSAVTGSTDIATNRPVPPTQQLQQCLNIFRDLFPVREDHAEILQKVKGHLFNRDFATAFSKPEYLNVYALRWSPSRALAYCAILQDLDREVGLRDANAEEGGPQDYRVVCIGGGAGAEIVAFASWCSTWPTSVISDSMAVATIDIADWHRVVEGLANQVVSAPAISQYASTAIKENNRAMISSDQFTASFIQRDVLEWPIAEAQKTLSLAKMITLMFTLNELYSISISKTQEFLAQITLAAQPNTLLLIVDSPGSYSTVSINGTEKRYPMQWLLDITLLGPPPRAGMVMTEPKWERIVSDDSRWFRMPPSLSYPIDLENMRYQIHLYRRRTG